MSLFVVEGQTAPIDCALYADGVVYSLVGCTVTTIATLLSGGAKTLAGTTSVTDAAAGKVRFSPDAADFLSAEFGYKIRFRVVRADSKIEFWPTGERETWIVLK